MIKKYNELLISYFDEIVIESFCLTEIWYEYYTPNEFKLLENHGFDEEWLHSKFIEENPDPENHVKYTLLNDALFNTEFSYLKCTINLDDIVLVGNAFKIINNINALSIFYDNKTFDFCNPSVFEKENRATLKKLFKALKIDSKPNIKFLKVNYSKELSSFFNLSDTFEISEI